MIRRGRLAALGLFCVALLVPTSAPPAAAANSLSMLGADVSSVQRALDLGAKYYDANGTARDPLDILTSLGIAALPTDVQLHLRRPHRAEE